MTKKTVGQVNKEAEAKDLLEAQAFAEAIKAVEAEHGMRIVPMLEYSSQGMYPTLGRQRVDNVELKADKKPEQEDKDVV